MATFMVIYTYDPDRTDDRMAARPEHRAFLHQLAGQGVVAAAGAYADDQPPGGALVLQATDTTQVAAVLDQDPYYRAGVISNREIRSWGTIIGPWADAD